MNLIHINDECDEGILNVVKNEITDFQLLTHSILQLGNFFTKFFDLTNKTVPIICLRSWNQ